MLVHFVKVHIYKVPLWLLYGLFKPNRFGVEGSLWHSARLCSLPEGHFFISPVSMNLAEVIRQRPGRPSQLDPPRFCRRYALRLPLPDVLPLIFGLLTK